MSYSIKTTKYGYELVNSETHKTEYTYSDLKDARDQMFSLNDGKELTKYICPFCNNQVPSLVGVGRFAVCWSCRAKVKRKSFRQTKHFRLRIFLQQAKAFYDPVIPEVFSFFLQSEAKWGQIAREVWNQDASCDWTDFYWTRNVNLQSLKDVQIKPLSVRFKAYIKDYLS